MLKTRTNILYIFHISSVGGGSFCLLSMIKRLNRNLFNPIVLLKNDGPLVSELKKLEVNVFFESSISTVPYNRSLFAINSIKQFIFCAISQRKIAHWVRKADADIVHINTMMMYPYSIPIKKMGKKVIVHMREHWPHNQHQIQFSLAKKIIEKYADRIIAINNTSSNILGLPKKTEVIYDWIDFENRDKNIDFQNLFGPDYRLFKIFLFLGGMQKIKGALEVVQVFSKKIAIKNARLLFVGCDTKEFDKLSTFKGRVKAILRRINIPVFSDKLKLIAQKDTRIIFIPSTSQVKSLIEQSYCLVSYPIIPHAILPIAEAISLCKPVISADTPEAREYSNEGNSAQLFEMNNKVDFEKALLSVLDDDKYFNELAERGSLNIHSTFDPVKNSKLLNNLYIKLIN